MFVGNVLSLCAALVWLQSQFPAAESHVIHNTTSYVKDDFYARKMKVYFAATDANRDGLISTGDYDTMATRFIHLVHLCRYDAKILLFKKVPRIWHAFYHDKAGKGYPANMDEMISSVRDRKLQPELGISVNQFAGQEFDIVDLDGDGKLSRWEHTIDFKSRGVDTKSQAKSFAAIDTNKDGYIERDEFTSGAESFFTSEDENCPSKDFYGII